MYFCRQHIEPQENYKDHAPEDVLERHRDNPRFAALIGGNTQYGWTDEGPDLVGIARSNRAGRTWHA